MWNAVEPITLGLVAVVVLIAALTKPSWWALGYWKWWVLHCVGLLMAAVASFIPVTGGLFLPMLVYVVFVHSITDLMFRRASENHMMVAIVATIFCHLTYSMRTGIWDAGYFVIPIVIFFLLFVLCPSADTMMAVLLYTIFMPEILATNNNAIILSVFMVIAMVVIYMMAKLIKSGKTVPVIPVMSASVLLAVPFMI